MSQTPRPSALSRVWAVIRNSPFVKRSIALDVIQGTLVGAGLAFVTAILLILAQVIAMQTTVNGLEQHDAVWQGQQWHPGAQPALRPTSPSTCRYVQLQRRLLQPVTWL